MKRVLLLAAIALMLASCASSRTLTRDEWLQVGQRTYSGTTKEALIRNAEKVLFLADGNDVKFSDTKNGFQASRQWLIYMVIAASVGTDYWSFEVEEKGDKLFARVSASQAVGNVNGYVAGGQGGTVTSPTVGAPIQGSATYDMFWGRLDYLQGLRADWPDCKSGLAKEKRGETWGDLDHICDSVTLKDDLPSNLSDSEIERIFKQTNPPDDRIPKAKARYLKNRQAAVSAQNK